MLRKVALLAAGAAVLFGAETVKTPVDNADVRVLDAVLQPHEKTGMHKHDLNRVIVYKDAGSESFQFASGSHSTMNFGKNQVQWNPVSDAHTTEVTTAKPVGIIEIELKKKGAGLKVTTPLDTLKVDPKHYKLEFENDQVRVIRAHFPPHEGAPMHEHQLKRVLVYLTDAKTKVTSADGTVDQTPRKAGDIVYSGAAKHSEINTLDTATEVLVIELKY